MPKGALRLAGAADATGVRAPGTAPQQCSHCCQLVRRVGAIHSCKRQGPALLGQLIVGDVAALQVHGAALAGPCGDLRPKVMLTSVAGLIGRPGGQNHLIN